LALRALRDAEPDLVRERLRALTRDGRITVERTSPTAWRVH